jgi:glutaminyl-peptide cyclotransferase
MNRRIFFFIIIFVVLVFAIYILVNRFGGESKQFNAERAYQDVVYQVSLGPRIPGSKAHQEVQSWISKEIEAAGWKFESQNGNFENVPIRNLIAKRGSGARWIILAAHYDSRIYADRDPDITKQNEPVPGANDGASGVAILIELARSLRKNNFDQTIWLVFLDAEDNGNINSYDWSMGSRFFVSKLEGKPDQVIIIDMIGDKDLNIYMEKNSDLELTRSIWDEAAKLGYQQFITQPKYRIIDDHLPFIEKGITAIDIIDFDYPYWHTSQDTSDKVSAQSLQVIGDTLISWILRK